MSTEGKFKVIQEQKKEKRNADMCRDFGFVNSTVQEIFKNRTKIISQCV
jgi:hypothetical protein